MPRSPKTIVIYFTDPDADDYPFDEEEYREAYHILAKLLAERGADCVIVRGQGTYRGGNDFDGGWRFDGEAFRRTDDVVQGDLIFNRGRFAPGAGAHVINNIELNRFCDDKYATYKAYEKLCPLTLLVKNQKELDATMARIPTDTVVCKPIDGLGGEGICVGRREELRTAVRTFPCLVQEFLDTSDGIPGIADGYHDFRMISIKGEIVCVFVRQPRKGSLLANVSQGGSVFEVPVRKIPGSAREIFRKVDRTLERFPDRVYCVDVARGTDGAWKIIELNAQPGLSSYDYKGYNDPDGAAEGSRRYFHGLANLLAAAV